MAAENLRLIQKRPFWRAEIGINAKTGQAGGGLIRQTPKPTVPVRWLTVRIRLSSGTDTQTVEGQRRRSSRRMTAQGKRRRPASFLERQDYYRQAPSTSVDVLPGRGTARDGRSRPTSKTKTVVLLTRSSTSTGSVVVENTAYVVFVERRSRGRRDQGQGPRTSARSPGLSTLFMRNELSRFKVRPRTSK